MTDENPDGAIDNDFAENERSAVKQIADGLAEHNQEIRPGDIAIDLVYHRPLFIRRSVADSCVDYWEDGKDFDITTYKAHPYLPVEMSDEVFECVFVPTKPGDIRHKTTDDTYDYPSGRLARVPIEHLWESKRRYQSDQKASTLAAFLSTADASHGGGAAGSLLAVAEDVFDDAIIDDALERAGMSEWKTPDTDSNGALTE